MMSATSAASASGVSVSVTAVSGGAGGIAAGGATGRMTGGMPGAGCGLSVSVAAASAGLLAVASACTTPRTPEILNSLIAMSNPLDEYPYNGNNKRGAAGYKSGSPNDSNSNSNSSPASSPATGTPPSIQKTCSDLIKAGLKLSIESKRKLSGSDSADAPTECLKKLKKEEPPPSDEDYDSGHTQTSRSEGLTPEDEERRRRRRERNKIAATKCRLKKRERTVNLVSESEVLENQNFDLKSQIKELEVQRLQLVEMLNIHTSSCMKNGNSTSPTTPYNNARQPYDSPNNYQTASTINYDTNSPYIRPESANILASSYTCHTPAINNENAVYENSTNMNPNTQHLDNLDINVNSPYITNQQHIIDTEYHRPDSAMHASNVSDVSYGPDNYLQKPNLLIIEPSDNDYSEQMSNYDNAEFHMAQQMSVNRQQQCHNFNNGNSEVPNKLNSNSLNNGCLA